VAWAALPEAYVPASIALRVTGAHKPVLLDMAVVLEGNKTIWWHNELLNPTINFAPKILDTLMVNNISREVRIY
jgi:hypothetical protein